MTDELRVKMKLETVEFEFSGTGEAEKEWIKKTTETLIVESQKAREDDIIDTGYPKKENKLSA